MWSILVMISVGLGMLTLVAWVVAYRRIRANGYITGGLALVVGLGLLVPTLAAGALAVATQGFDALTREVVAAEIRVEPNAEEARGFKAHVTLPDGTTRRFEVRGDQLAVEAQIVKWKPMLNVLGLHTAYELDRLTGRYRDPEMAETAPRTVYSLGEKRYIEVVGLIDRFPLLGRVVDAEYGSGTFVEVDREKQLEVRVSTSGLLIREVVDGSTIRDGG